MGRFGTVGYVYLMWAIVRCGAHFGHYVLDAQQAGARPCGNAVLDSVDAGFDGITVFWVLMTTGDVLTRSTVLEITGTFIAWLPVARATGGPALKSIPMSAAVSASFPPS